MPTETKLKREMARYYARKWLENNPGWHRTQDIAEGIGMDHEAGANDDIVHLRAALYNLVTLDGFQLQERQNGHLWRNNVCDDCGSEGVAARDVDGRQFCENCCNQHGLFPGEGVQRRRGPGVGSH